MATDRPGDPQTLSRDPTAAPPAGSPQPSTVDRMADRQNTPPGDGSRTGPYVPADAPGLAPPGYELLGELGRGGMGVVYKARQERLNRLVALKMILSGGHAGAVERLRFLTEAEVVAGLKHPHVVPVYEFGTHGGQPFYSMEYLGGGSLSDRIRGTPMPPPAAAELVEKLARAMHAAHGKGVIHRDLKPGNVLLADDGTPKVVDFGLARRAASDLTATEAVMGTPSYMAPEQAEGRAREVGPETDVYALGAILYASLTGKPPFQSDSTARTLELVRTQEPTRVRSVNRAVPRDLETICLKCLEKEPGKRYTSAEALADDLRRFAAGEPITARPVGQVERAMRWARRKPTQAGLLAAVGLLAVVVPMAVEMGLLWKRAEGERDTNMRLLGEMSIEQNKTINALARETTALKVAEEAKENLEQASYLRQVDLAYREWQAGRAASARAYLAACPEARRGWEWRYVHRVCHPERLVIAGADDHRCYFALSPDGKRIAYIAPGKFVVEELDTGKRVFERPGEKVFGAALSPDGRVAWGTGSGPARIANLVSGAVISFDQGYLSYAVVFSPDGTRLAVVSGPELRVWDIPTDRQWAVVPPVRHGFPIGLAFTPDGRQLLVPSDGWLYVWDIGTQLTSRHKVPDIHAGRPAVDWDGKRMVLVTRTGAMLAGLPHGGPQTVYPHGGPVQSLAVDWERKRVATGGGDRLIKVWDLESGRLLETLVGCEAGVTDLAFRSGTGELVSGEGDDVTRRAAIRVWAVGGTTPVIQFAIGRSIGRSIWFEDAAWGFSPNSSAVAVGLSSGFKSTLSTYDLRTGGTIAPPIAIRDVILAVRTGGREGEWNVLVSSASILPTGGRYPIWYPKIRTDAGPLAVRSYRTADGQEAKPSVPLTPGSCEGATFSRDGRRMLITRGADP